MLKFLLLREWELKSYDCMALWKLLLLLTIFFATGDAELQHYNVAVFL